MAKKRYKGKRYTASERRAYWIGVGFGAKSIGVSPSLKDSFDKGLSQKANVNILSDKVNLKKNK